jgi:glycosyltransferase involved in cell wall biosynthesis
MRPEVLAFVWVYPNQRGFHPYIYRLHSLLAHFDTRVVVNDSASIPKLELPPDRCLVVPCGSSSLGAQGVYGLCMAATRARLRPERTVFLASLFAPFLAVARPSRSALFWEEHPLHAYPQHPRGRIATLKRIKNAAMLRLYYAGARAAGAVMPTGVDMVEDLRGHGCISTRIHDIPLGVDPLFAPPSIGDAPPRPKTDVLRLVCVGRLTEERGGPILFDALAAVNRNGIKVHLTLPGPDEWDRAYIAKRSADPAIRNALTVRDRPLRGAYIAQLRHEDVGFCLTADTPYRAFGVQTKLFEFLAAGLPVIANDLITHTRYLKHGHDSWLVNFTAASVAEALEMLWRERDTLLPKLRAGAAESGRAYMWPALESQFLRIVRSL